MFLPPLASLSSIITSLTPISVHNLPIFVCIHWNNDAIIFIYWTLWCGSHNLWGLWDLSLDIDLEAKRDARGRPRGKSAVSSKASISGEAIVGFLSKVRLTSSGRDKRSISMGKEDSSEFRGSRFTASLGYPHLPLLQWSGPHSFLTIYLL